MSNFDHQRFPSLEPGLWFRSSRSLSQRRSEFPDKPDLVADVCELTMLPSGYYEEIIAQDVLEHLPRTSTSKALREWNRLLQVGGRLYLRVPSLEALASLFQQSNSFERHAELDAFFVWNPSLYWRLSSY
ncbi:MAG: methyltransferase domain-containing protein [Candidatus Competibacteraceae bacterium]|nr:methyltransferase domain-containing protein [Candidatus Competibacteraceae bacterium]